MLALAIILALTIVLYEDIVQDQEPNYIRFIMPLLVGLVTWNALLGLLVLVTFYTVFDPVYNWMSDKPIFHSDKLKFRDVIRGRTGLYHVWNGRIILMIEVFLLVVIISELLI